MPEGYVYRTTVEGLIAEQDALVDQFGGDLDALEEQLGAEVEMHLRSLKRELKCARTLLEDEVSRNCFLCAFSQSESTILKNDS